MLSQGWSWAVAAEAPHEEQSVARLELQLPGNVVISKLERIFTRLISHTSSTTQSLQFGYQETARQAPNGAASPISTGELPALPSPHIPAPSPAPKVLGVTCGWHLPVGIAHRSCTRLGMGALLLFSVCVGGGCSEIQCKTHVSQASSPPTLQIN